MRVLLILAHGSNRDASNEEVRHLCQTLSERLEGQFALIEAAFLELAQPGIGEAIDRVVAHGASEVVLLPYFLAAGRHVAEDIPAIVSDRQSRYPQIDIQLYPHVGAMPGLPDLLITELERGRPGVPVRDDR